jgi:hypothetical protein
MKLNEYFFLLLILRDRQLSVKSENTRQIRQQQKLFTHTIGLWTLDLLSENTTISMKNKVWIKNLNVSEILIIMFKTKTSLCIKIECNGYMTCTALVLLFSFPGIRVFRSTNYLPCHWGGWHPSNSQLTHLLFIILFSGVTSLPLTTTSRPSLGGENQI